MSGKTVCQITALRKKAGGAVDYGRSRVIDQARDIIMGKADFFDDQCLRTQHIVMHYDVGKFCLYVQLLAPTPAFYWRKGSDQKLPFPAEQKVLLYDGDRLTLMENLHLHEVEIAPTSELQRRHPVTVVPIASEESFL
eukprot:NODE_4042_length_873_cov_21.839806_g3728_i0.p1 GENE.NODE_4042_length_873_cov_21.839806_g3728_i0~~NODE_4042_length_873_cov_21.839806_g3728_i0.p1  ORF type:complete len:138 (+),score=28.21 NODE_4042_length_873_cov_21.839806_g3728_i0:139-552(+)